MKKLLIALLTSLSLLATTVQPQAQVVITGDYGGSIVTYIEKYNTIRQVQGRVILDDICISACTLVLGLVPLRDVCANPHAVFGFHSAWINSFAGPVYSKDGTALVWALYPENVRARLKELGWDGGEHPDLVFVKATEFVPSCTGGYKASNGVVWTAETLREIEKITRAKHD